MSDPTPWIATQAATGPIEFISRDAARMVARNGMMEFVIYGDKARQNPAWFNPPYLKRKVSFGQYRRALVKYLMAQRRFYSFHGGSLRRASYWGRVCKKWAKILDAYTYHRKLNLR